MMTDDPTAADTLDAAAAVFGIVFPEPAGQINMNDRGHYLTRARLVKIWRHAALYATVDAINRGHLTRAMPLSFVQLSLPTAQPKRRRDPSNWAPTTKAVVDGMTDAGLWIDDDSTHVITLEPHFHRHTTRIGRMVYVRVAPVSGPWRPDTKRGLFS